jgi:hypothetical protein
MPRRPAMGMRCPVCKNSQFKEIDLHSGQFFEDIVECRVCETVWSISHGATEIIREPQAQSFLAVNTESVDGQDYS